VRPVTRITPALPPQAMKTYALAAPLQTHWRPATCEEVDCPQYLHGWKTVVDETTDLGREQAAYIREKSGRRFEATWDGGLTTFVFEAGQQCFATHQQPLEREPIYLVRDGDFRGNPRGTSARVHTRAEFWVEDFGGHQQRLADRIKEG